MTAIELAYENKYGKIEIFFDYIGIEKWVNGKWKAKTTGTKKYVNFIKSYQNKISISFNKVKAHSEVISNECTDRLAAEAMTRE